MIFVDEPSGDLSFDVCGVGVAGSAAAVGSTTLAVGIVAVAVVGDVPEVVEATCCTLGPPRPFVITTLALANEVPGNGEAVAEAAGISIVLNHVRYQLICKDDLK